MFYILLNAVAKASIAYTQDIHAIVSIVDQTLSKQNYFTGFLRK